MLLGLPKSFYSFRWNKKFNSHRGHLHTWALGKLAMLWDFHRVFFFILAVFNSLPGHPDKWASGNSVNFEFSSILN